jgi:hypothetical protein
VLKKMQHRDNVKSAGFFKNMFTALTSEANAPADANANVNGDGGGGAAAESNAAGGAATDVDLKEDNVTI